MLINTIFQHKAEKERLLAKTYITRKKYDFGMKYLSTPLIKVITGPRRAGKSVFALLLLKNKDFAYINFDDENLLNLDNYDDLLKAIFEVYPKTNYILFDEIQNLPNWEIFVSKLHRRGYNLILTGSNARLLSRELSTALTGRFISLEILPFGFLEYLAAKKYYFSKEELNLPEKKGELSFHLKNYLVNGGFPEIVISDLYPKTYLETLFDAILLKDIVKRYNVRFSQKISDLALYLSSNLSSEFSFNRLKNILEFRSTSTLQNYLKYLEEAYLVFLLNRYSFKIKEQIKTAKKIYLVDNGLALAKSFQFSQNFGQLIENLVFIELVRKGYKLNNNLFCYQTRNGRQIDFLLRKGLQVEKLIQVSSQIEDWQTREREVKALKEASQELNCQNLEIISWNKEGKEKIGHENETITFTPLINFLLFD